MLGAVAAEGFRRLHERLAEAAAVAASGDALPGMVRAYLAFAAAHPALYRLAGPQEQEKALDDPAGVLGLLLRVL